jgi:hypothetical protein
MSDMRILAFPIAKKLKIVNNLLRTPVTRPLPRFTTKNFVNLAGALTIAPPMTFPNISTILKVTGSVRREKRTLGEEGEGMLTPARGGTP